MTAVYSGKEAREMLAPLARVRVATLLWEETVSAEEAGKMIEAGALLEVPLGGEPRVRFPFLRRGH